MKMYSKIILVVVIVISTFAVFLITCTKMVTHKGVVLSHTTSSDRTGDVNYHTIVSSEDGSVKSLRGLEYYIVPVGGKVSYDIRVLK